MCVVIFRRLDLYWDCLIGSLKSGAAVPQCVQNKINNVVLVYFKSKQIRILTKTLNDNRFYANSGIFKVNQTI